MLTIDQINKILDVNDSYKQPAKLLELMLDDEKRLVTFEKFLGLENDLTYEWFQQAFEDEHADRKDKKQDFTPNSISELMAKLVVSYKTYHETAAGNGGIAIKNWFYDKEKNSNYMPNEYWYHLEELSDRSLPFLIFNMAIRGLHGTILHGDSLSREFKNVYFLNNSSNNRFSEVIVMPKVKRLEDQLDIRRWIDG